MAKRNNNGTFAEGNQAAKGHGRPSRRIEASYLVALTEAVTPDDWQEIIAKAVTDAKQGDDKARTWLSKYLLGGDMPAQRKRPTLKSAHSQVDSVDDEIKQDKFRREMFGD